LSSLSGRVTKIPRPAPFRKQRRAFHALKLRRASRTLFVISAIGPISNYFRVLDRGRPDVGVTPFFRNHNAIPFRTCVDSEMPSRFLMAFRAAR
jgi:hypothetical protein